MCTVSTSGHSDIIIKGKKKLPAFPFKQRHYSVKQDTKIHQKYPLQQKGERTHITRRDGLGLQVDTISWTSTSSHLFGKIIPAHFGKGWGGTKFLSPKYQ